MLLLSVHIVQDLSRHTLSAMQNPESIVNIEYFKGQIPAFQSLGRFETSVPKTNEHIISRGLRIESGVRFLLFIPHTGKCAY